MENPDAATQKAGIRTYAQGATSVKGRTSQTIARTERNLPTQHLALAPNVAGSPGACAAVSGLGYTRASTPDRH